MKKVFHNTSGKVFAVLEGTTLKKSEHQKDRLKVTGGRSHAVDADLLEEAIEAGAEFLEVSEKAIPAGKRIFRIPLRDIYRHGRRLNLAGVIRWTVPLAACELISGSEEEWRLADRQTLLEAEKRRSEVEEIRAEQLTLFSDEEKSYWKTRFRWETLP